MENVPSSSPEVTPHARPETESTPELTYLVRPWHSENVLHVYPYTFNEKRREGEVDKGIGSILGITEKLDWMQETGVTAIWLGPIYESPGLDANYDVSDYRAINPDLGTMEDVDELIAEAHKRDIRVIFDLVPNHTSDKSEWFQASSDPDHPDHEKYKDYYRWLDPVKGELPEGIVAGDGDRLKDLPDGYTVPNNWSSIFSTSQIEKVKEQHGGVIPDGVEVPAVTAWVWNKKRQQFYLAEFLKEQPSLNWENETVREEIKDVVRFWLDKGVDSFRVDVMNHIGKDPSYSDEDPAEVGTEIGQYRKGITNPHDQLKQEKLVSHWPQLGKYVRDLLSVLDDPKYEHVRLVFEDWMSALSGNDKLSEIEPDKANVFNFKTLVNTNREHWSARTFSQLIEDYYGRMADLDGAVPNQVTGNHDVDALRTRLESAPTARAALFMLGALPGALYVWQADLLNRPNMIVPKDLQKDGDIGQRDGERVPIAHDSSHGGGFSSVEQTKSWLPTADPAEIAKDNLELQAKDPSSPYRLIRELFERRKQDPALRGGDIQMLHTDHPDVLAFSRPDPTDPRRQAIFAVNFSADTVSFSIPDAEQVTGRVTLSASHGYERGDTQVDLQRGITIGPDEGYMIETNG